MNLYIGKGHYVQKQIKEILHEMRLGGSLLMLDFFKNLIIPIARGARLFGEWVGDKTNLVSGYHAILLFQLVLLPYFVFSYAKIPPDALNPSSPMHLMASVFGSKPEIMIGLFVVGIFFLSLSHNPLMYGLSCIPLLLYGIAIAEQVVEGKYPQTALLGSFTILIVVVLAGMSIRDRFINSKAILLLNQVREENRKLSSENEKFKKEKGIGAL